jgi:hypothetical protein
MPIVSVDLAYGDYRDFGLAVLESGLSGADYQLLPFASNSARAPTPERVADVITDVCSAVGATLALLDGPQGWKDPSNGLVHSRVCERYANAPGKTGLPGNAKPAGYLKFIGFCIEVFDALQGRGWKRYDPLFWRPDEQWVVETLPLRAWRSLGHACLPAKSKATVADIRNFLEQLIDSGALARGCLPTHDQLQALVAGLGGLGIAANDQDQYEALGVRPLDLCGTWREGYIISPQKKRHDSHRRNPDASHGANGLA